MLIEDIEFKVNKIIFNCLKDRITYQDITKEKNLITDLYAESMELIDIFYSIMAEFEIELDRNAISNLRYLNDIYVYVNEEVNKKVAMS